MASSAKEDFEEISREVDKYLDEVIERLVGLEMEQAIVMLLNCIRSLLFIILIQKKHIKKLKELNKPYRR